MDAPPTPGVLFVDDDAHLLKSLERMLWRRLKGWRTQFAPGTEEALALLEQEQFCAVVSDILMPGRDGIELLDLVKRRHPLVMRVILSGASGDRDVLDAVEVAHQYLSKPCDVEALVRVLNETAACCRGTNLERGIRAGIADIGFLPCLGENLEALETELDKPEPSVRVLGSIAAGDPGLAANLLKLVSTPFFGFSKSGAGPETAVSMLGTGTMARLVAERHVLPAADAGSELERYLKGLWRHSRMCAAMAEEIAAMEGMEPGDVERVRTAGLLHDVGKVVWALRFAEQSRELHEASRRENASIYSLERRVVAADHARAGAFLLRLWGCGGMIADAVEMHHRPERQADHALAVALVHAANCLEHELVVINKDYAVNPLDAEYLAESGLDGRMDAWRRACARLAKKHAGR